MFFSKKFYPEILRFLFLFSACLFISPTSFADEDDANINLQGQIPRAEFTSTKFDFGDVWRGQTVGHSFFFQNNGNGTLVLSNIHAECGCLNAVVTAGDGKTEKNIFKPGEQGVLKVDFDSSLFSGRVTRDVTLQTNMGSSSPPIAFKLSANVKQELASDPDLLYVGRMQKDKVQTFIVNLNLKERANHSGVTKVSGVESTVPYVQAKWIEADSPNHAQIQVTVGGEDLPVGPFHTNLIVKNNSNYYKNFVIPVVGEVSSSLQISGKYIEFGVIRQGNSSQKKMIFRSEDENFDLTSVKVDFRRIVQMPGITNTDLFEIKKGKLEDDSGYVVTFRLLFPKKINWPKESSVGSEINVSGNFIVKTNDPDYKEITVPFFGVLRKNSHD